MRNLKNKKLLTSKKNYFLIAMYKILFLRIGSSAEDAQWGQTTKNNLASIFITFKKGTDIDQYIKQLKKEQTDFKPAEFDYTKTSYSNFGGGNNLQFNVTANNETSLKQSR